MQMVSHSIFSDFQATRYCYVQHWSWAKSINSRNRRWRKKHVCKYIHLNPIWISVGDVSDRQKFQYFIIHTLNIPLYMCPPLNIPRMKSRYHTNTCWGRRAINTQHTLRMWMRCGCEVVGFDKSMFDSIYTEKSNDCK